MFRLYQMFPLHKPIEFTPIGEELVIGLPCLCCSFFWDSLFVELLDLQSEMMIPVAIELCEKMIDTDTEDNSRLFEYSLLSNAFLDVIIPGIDYSHLGSAIFCHFFPTH